MLPILFPTMPANYIEIQCPACKQTIRLEVDIVPAEPNYGADADGHRGIYVPAYAALVDDEPSECPHCKVDFMDDGEMDDLVHQQCERELEKLNEEL